MKVIIQLQYSLTDSRVFHDIKNITQSSLHSTQPNPPKIKKVTQPNPTHGWTQPMTNSDTVLAVKKNTAPLQKLLITQTGYPLNYLLE